MPNLADCRRFLCSHSPNIANTLKGDARSLIGSRINNCLDWKGRGVQTTEADCMLGSILHRILERSETFSNCSGPSGSSIHQPTEMKDRVTVEDKMQQIVYLA